MTDKIQTAYEASKNIYDDVLTQGNLFSRLYIRLFWSGTDDRKIARRVLSYIRARFPMFRSEQLCSRNANGRG